jgi:hypothetical protein
MSASLRRSINFARSQVVANYRTLLLADFDVTAPLLSFPISRLCDPKRTFQALLLYSFAEPFQSLDPAPATLQLRELGSNLLRAKFPIRVSR